MSHALIIVWQELAKKNEHQIAEQGKKRSLSKGGRGSAGPQKVGPPS